MTPKIIELKQAPVVLVELEERPTKVEDSLTNGFIYTDKKGYMESFYLDDICEDSKLIGILSDLTEEQFVEWVGKYEVNKTNYYQNYTPKPGRDFRDVIDQSFISAKESFYSLLESENVYTENPYSIPTRENLRGKPAEAHSEIREHMRRWTEAQSRTIAPKRTVVLIKRV